MLPESVKKSLAGLGLVPGKSTLVAGVSGGIDSMVMLELFHTIHFTVNVVHINYHTRDRASELDEELVRTKADEYGFEITVINVTPDQTEGNFQEWARNIRYDAFREEMAKSRADAIAVAHNRDDQIETILFKILHGAGPDSWLGMKVFSKGIIRPLLTVSRSEIDEYAAENHIEYRDDESNLHSTYARNLIRNEWIPRLDKLVPGWQENLLEIPGFSVAYRDAANRVLEYIKSGRDGLNRIKLLELSPGLQKTVVADYLKKRFDVPGGVSRSSLHALDRLDKLQTGKKIQLSNGIALIRDRERFVAVRVDHEPVRLFNVNYDRLLKGPVIQRNVRLQLHDVHEFDPKPGMLMIDASKVSWPLSIRPWKAGDRFRPLGMKGHQKISDHLSNRKIDASRKQETQVAVGIDGLICAVIFPPSFGKEPGTLSESVKCDSATDKVITIEYKID